MTEKTKDRLMQGLVSLIISIAIVLLGFSLERDVKKSDDMNHVLNQKADKQWVKDQDEKIIDDISDYKEEHSKLHDSNTELLNSMDRKIDILLQKIN
jgi:uncharacterized protein YacL